MLGHGPWLGEADRKMVRRRNSRIGWDRVKEFPDRSCLRLQGEREGE